MDVSHFELIFKPQAPSAPAGLPNVDRVLQGYFLEITNVEDTEYLYRLEFVISPPPPGTPNQAFRTLAGNTIVFVDTPGTDNQQGILTGGLATSVFRPSTGFVRVPPGGTALVAVLPSAFGPVPGDPTPLVVPNFEVRGYVRIELPALFDFPSFSFVPQSVDPVTVLLTPQNRATYLTAANTISDQTQASLPLASGQAHNSLDPEPGGPIVFPGVFPDISAEIADLLQETPLESRAELLAVLMAQIDPETADLTAFNKALANAQIPMAIERRTL